MWRPRGVVLQLWDLKLHDGAMPRPSEGSAALDAPASLSQVYSAVPRNLGHCVPRARTRVDLSRLVVAAAEGSAP
jgi:hypothetical protein